MRRELFINAALLAAAALGAVLLGLSAARPKSGPMLVIFIAGLVLLSTANVALALRSTVFKRRK